MVNFVLYNCLMLNFVKLYYFITSKVGNYFQYCKMKYEFPHTDGSLVFDKSTVFKYKHNISIGKNVTIGPRVSIGAKSNVTLSDYVRISQGVIIETAGCDLDTSVPYKHKSAPIFIGENVWIGSNAIILSGVSIGKNTVVGAGAIVYKDVPENMIVLPSKSTYVMNPRFKNDC